MTTNLQFWIPNLGIPIIALMANVVIRWTRGLPQSAVPDLVLCFVVFDALVAIQHDDFQKFIRIDALAPAVQSVYTALLIGTLVIWFIMVTEIEHRLVLSYAARGTVLNLNGMMRCWHTRHNGHIFEHRAIRISSVGQMLVMFELGAIALIVSIAAWGIFGYVMAGYLMAEPEQFRGAIRNIVFPKKNFRTGPIQKIAAAAVAFTLPQPVIIEFGNPPQRIQKIAAAAVAVTLLQPMIIELGNPPQDVLQMPKNYTSNAITISVVQVQR